MPRKKKEEKTEAAEPVVEKKPVEKKKKDTETVEVADGLQRGSFMVANDQLVLIGKTADGVEHKQVIPLEGKRVGIALVMK